MAKTEKKTASVSLGSTSVRSEWECFSGDSVTIVIGKGPTEGKATVSGDYKLDKGAKIKSAKVWMKFGSPLTGAAYVKVNGSSNRTEEDGLYGYDLDLLGESGTITVTIAFKANGNAEKVGKHSAVLTVDNITAKIEYEVEKKDDSDPAQTDADKEKVKTKKLVVQLGSIGLTSSWYCEKKDGKWGYKSGPTTDKKTVSGKYKLPSGAKIKSAKLTFQRTSTPSPIGGGILKINGGNSSSASGTDFSIKIKLKETSGTAAYEFSYQSYGRIVEDDKKHAGGLTLGNIQLTIKYQVGTETTKKKKQRKFYLPPQAVCVYDQESGQCFYFDGVTKIQHTLSMKIEEEPSKKKEEYVNNARNEPDKVTIDITSSDVYSGGGNLYSKIKLNGTQEKAFSAAQSQANAAKTSWLLSNHSSHSEKGFYRLKQMKEDRRKLSLITQQYVYTDMVVASITVTQDDQHTFGWEGQVAFQHAYPPKEVKKTTKKTAGNTETRTTSETYKIMSTLGSGGDV